MCFKHFKKRKYYYGRTLTKESQTIFFLSDDIFFLYETKMTGVNKI